MNEHFEIRDIPESEFPMSEDEERIVRSLGSARLALDAKFPEILETGLVGAVLLPHDGDSWVYLKMDSDLTEAWLTDSDEDPIGSGTFLGRVDYSFRPDNKPFVEHGVEGVGMSSEQAEETIGQALKRIKEARKL